MKDEVYLKSIIASENEDIVPKIGYDFNFKIIRTDKLEGHRLRIWYICGDRVNLN